VFQYLKNYAHRDMDIRDYQVIIHLFITVTAPLLI